MDTRRLVDPELASTLDELPRLEVELDDMPAIRARTGEAFRALAAGRPANPGPPRATTDTRTISGPDGTRLAVDVSRPVAPCVSRSPAVLWMHGGGFVMGSVARDRPRVEALAAELDAVVISPDYRLAPETRFPGPLEDCYAALEWISAAADELGIDAGRIALAGESAGGGLAAALALLARDRAELAVRYQALIYPMLDDRVSTSSLISGRNPATGAFVWTHETNLAAWTGYLGREPGADDVSAYAAPARAVDVRGLPPTFIGVGSLDLFVDEDLAYASHLIRAGVPVELHIYAGAFHAFLGIEKTAITQRLRRDLYGALRIGLA